MKRIWRFRIWCFLGIVLGNGGCVAQVPPIAGQPPPAVIVSAPPADPNAYPMSEDAAMFYDGLAPYGEWLWVAPYGWVWTPAGVAADWRPYSDGSWAYTEDGWTWVSEAPWGWAPFHYGRWFFHENRGWCWAPDRVWAPAWVSWHFGDAWCGWAPLPPGVAWDAVVNWDVIIPPFGWCFVGREDFLRPHLRERIIVPARNVTLLRETRNVTRFEVRERRVFNASISAEQIERFTGRAVPRLKVVEAPSPGEAHHIRRGELSVFRPAPRPGTPIVTRPAPGPVVRPSQPAQSWEELRRTEAERARMEAAQRAQHEALERAHERELRQPPRGMSPGEIQQRHQAEHQAMDQQIMRERHVFENRAAGPPQQGRLGRREEPGR